MDKGTKSKIRVPRTLVSKFPLRFTALLYLREALLREQYEHCGEIVTVARELGAKDADINDVLEAPVRAIYDTS